jgi:uncharacterized protein involved in oxidation of intracellular sulfur
VLANVLLIINGAAYGSELPFNGLRLATVLGKRDGVHVRLFLMGDAVISALDGQQVPDGYSTWTGWSARSSAARGWVGCCGTCKDARAIGDKHLVEGAGRSSIGPAGGLELGSRPDRVGLEPGSDLDWAARPAPFG